MKNIEMGKMESGRALQQSLFIRNACGYKAKLVLGFLLFQAKTIFFLMSFPHTNKN